MTHAALVGTIYVDDTHAQRACHDVATAIGCLFSGLDRECATDVLNAWPAVVRLLRREDAVGAFECGSCRRRYARASMACKCHGTVWLVPAGSFHLQRLRDWTDLRTSVLVALRNHQTPSGDRHWRIAADGINALENALVGGIY